MSRDRRARSVTVLADRANVLGLRSDSVSMRRYDARTTTETVE